MAGPARTSSALNTTSEESFHRVLRQRNVSALGWTTWWLVPLYLGWAGLDFFLEPEHFRRFLGYRLAVAVIAPVLARLMTTAWGGRHVWLLTWVYCFSFGAFLIPMLPQVVHHFLPYAIGFTLVIVGIGVVPYWPVGRSLSCGIALYVSAVVVLLLWPPHASESDIISAAFIGATALMFAGAGTQSRYRLLHQEYLATRKLEESQSQLQRVQDELARLQTVSNDSVEDIGTWTRRSAATVQSLLSIDWLEVWIREDGKIRALYPSNRDESVPPPDSVITVLRSTPGELPSVLRPGMHIVKGNGGEVLGVVLLDAAASVRQEEQKFVLASFVHQLSGTLQLHRTRRMLREVEADREVSRQRRLARGIDLLSVCPECHYCYHHRVVECPEDGSVLRETLTPFRMFERYRLRRVLGEGGQGTVYAAWDEKDMRAVAVKLVSHRERDASDVRLRFAREVRMLSQMKHPNIVRIEDWGELDDGTSFCAMELLLGQNLRQVLRERGAGTGAEVAALLEQSASALAAVHGLGMLHRDFKPENVFLVEDETAPEGFTVKLLDFGTAHETLRDTRLTKTGFAVGTPQYMAPEQFFGADLDARSDLFSFAAVGFEALTGHQLGSFMDWPPVDAVTRNEPWAVSRYIQTANPVVDTAFQLGLSRARDHRPADAQEWVASFVAELKALPAVRNAGWSGAWGTEKYRAVEIKEASSRTQVASPDAHMVSTPLADDAAAEAVATSAAPSPARRTAE